MKQLKMETDFFVSSTPSREKQVVLTLFEENPNVRFGRIPLKWVSISLAKTEVFVPKASDFSKEKNFHNFDFYLCRISGNSFAGLGKSQPMSQIISGGFDEDLDTLRNIHFHQFLSNLTQYMPSTKLLSRCITMKDFTWTKFGGLVSCSPALPLQGDLVWDSCLNFIEIEAWVNPNTM